MIKYFNIITDNLSKDEIIYRLESYFNSHGSFIFECGEKIQLNNEYCDEEFIIYVISSRGLFGELTAETNDMFEIGFKNMTRDELVEICKICKNKIK